MPIRSALQPFTLLALVLLCASTAADEVKVEKCRLCSPPACRIKDQYAAAFTMAKTDRSDGIKVKEYTGYNPTDPQKTALVAHFTTLGGVNTNGSVTITNVLDRDYAVSVYYAHKDDTGKAKQASTTVGYLVPSNVACYHDMPKGMHTEDVQLVKALLKRS